MDYKIEHNIVKVKLNAGEKLISEAGALAWMTPNVSMEAKFKGGLSKSISRAATNESLFLTEFSADDGDGFLTFAGHCFGDIFPLKLKKGEEIICQKSAYLFSQPSVSLGTHFTKKIAAGLFGGEGLILQKLTGPGMVFVTMRGKLNKLNLKEGQTVKCGIGHVGLFEPSVDFDIGLQKNIKTAFFGGEGLFFSTLTGPGKVWMQSMGHVENNPHRLSLASSNPLGAVNSVTGIGGKLMPKL